MTTELPKVIWEGSYNECAARVVFARAEDDRADVVVEVAVKDAMGNSFWLELDHWPDHVDDRDDQVRGIAILENVIADLSGVKWRKAKA